MFTLSFRKSAWYLRLFLPGQKNMRNLALQIEGSLIQHKLVRTEKLVVDACSQLPCYTPSFTLER